MLQRSLVAVAALLSAAPVAFADAIDYRHLIERGRAALSAGRIDEAHQAFRKATEGRQDDAEGWVMLCHALCAGADRLPASTDEEWVSAQSEYEKAEAAARRAIDQAESSPEAWAALGRVLQRMGHASEAVSSLYHAQSLGNESVELLVDLTDALSDARQSALERQDYAEAESRLKEMEEALLKAESSMSLHAGILQRLGQVEMAKGNVETAANTYRRAIALTPEDVNLHNLHLDSIERAREGDKITEFNNSIRFYNGLIEEPALGKWYSARSHLLKGHYAYNKEQDYTKAAEEYTIAEQELRRCNRINPSYDASVDHWIPSVRSYRGFALMRANKLAEAEASFMAALDRKPGFETALKGLSDLMDSHWTRIGGEAGGTKEEFDELRAFAARVCVLNPNDADAWNNYGFFARESGCYEESYQAYRRSMMLAPENARIINDTALILVYHLSRDLDRAEEWLWQACDIAEEKMESGTDADIETYGDTLVNLMVLFNRNGDDDRAGEMFRRIEQELPERSELRMWRKRLFPEEAKRLAEERRQAREAAAESEVEKSETEASSAGDGKDQAANSSGD